MPKFHVFIENLHLKEAASYFLKMTLGENGLPQRTDVSAASKTPVFQQKHLEFNIDVKTAKTTQSLIVQLYKVMDTGSVDAKEVARATFPIDLLELATRDTTAPELAKILLGSQNLYINVAYSMTDLEELIGDLNAVRLMFMGILPTGDTKKHPNTFIEAILFVEDKEIYRKQSRSFPLDR